MNLSIVSEGNSIKAIVWDDTVEVYEVSKEHNNWFSKILGMNCRLVSFPENNTRPVDPRYSINNDQVSLADGYPLLVIGQASLDDLNGRMKSPLPMNRFRPNIVFYRRGTL
ncbi:MAG: MOSC domain-containing protein [Bacteroidota bacterium]